MSFESTIAFIMFSIVVAGTPGPANVLIAATAAAVGARRTIPCLLGVAAGTALLLGVVTFGLGTVVLEHPGIALAMKIAGSALLLWLSFKIATAPTEDGRPGKGSPVGFATAAGLQWINPKSWTVGTSAAAAYSTTEAAGPAIQAATMSGLFLVAALPACALWLVFGAGLRGVLDKARTRRRFNQAMGATLAASIVLVFL